jgi:hypothetical protein
MLENVGVNAGVGPAIVERFSSHAENKAAPATAMSVQTIGLRIILRRSGRKMVSTCTGKAGARSPLVPSPEKCAAARFRVTVTEIIYPERNQHPDQSMRYFAR